MASSKVLVVVKNTKTGQILSSVEADKNVDGSVDRAEKEMAAQASSFKDPDVKSYKLEEILG
jgi:hypothetical protein